MPLSNQLGDAVAEIFIAMRERETAINNTIDGVMKMARIPIIGNEGQHREQQDGGENTENNGFWGLDSDDRSISLRFHFGQ